MSTWKFEILQDIPEDFLLKYNSSNVFYHPNLIKVWLDTYKPLRKQIPIFIKGKSEGNEVFLPLVLWKRNWKNAFIKTIVAVGNSDYDYHNPVFKNNPTESDLQSFWDELVTYLKSNYKFDNIHISGISDVYVTDNEGWEKEDICPKLTLSSYNSPEDLLKSLKTSLRGDINRQIRRLKEIGSISMVHYKRWEDIPQDTFQKFLKCHSTKWPNSYKAPHFHENLLKEGLKNKIVDFSILKIDDKEIAWHLGFKDEENYYYYMPAGNPEYLKYSPVKIHLFMLISHAIEKEFLSFDHLRGDENYKSGWSNDSQYVNTLQLTNKNLKTSLKLKILKLRSILN